MSDLTKRLRGPVVWSYSFLDSPQMTLDNTPKEAADRIDALEAALRNLPMHGWGEIQMFEGNQECSIPATAESVEAIRKLMGMK